MIKIVALLSIFLLSSCANQETHSKTALQNETMPICKFPSRYLENENRYNSFNPDACIQKKIIKIIYEHAPAQYHRENVDYAFYRSLGIGFVIYVSDKTIPPAPPPSSFILGNWTDSPLYCIEIDYYGNFIRSSYLR